MPDLDDRIETRLRADAARRVDPEPPSLRDALDAVSGADVARRRPPVWIAAAAIVLLVVGLAVVLATQATRRQNSPAVPSPTVHRSRPPARHAPLVLRSNNDYGAAGVLAVPGHPTEYDVVVPFEPDNHPDRCGFYDPQVTIVEQSTSTVRLRVSGKVYEQKIGKNHYRAFGCAGGQWKRLRINLAAPIGDRTLYDSAHDRDIVADPRDFPDFGWVPPGFHRTGGHRPGTLTDTATGERDYYQVRPRCPQGTRTTYRKGKVISRVTLPPEPCRAELTLLIGPGLSPSQLGRHLHTVSINGYPGVLSTDLAYTPGHACVTWQEAPSMRGRQVCINNVANLNVDDLLRAARSVR